MRLLLSGGGDAKDVIPIDEFFISQIDLERTVLYIPVAMEADAYTYDQCLKWFTGVYRHLGVKNIEMCVDLNQAQLGEKYSAVFIGGGNTFKLLKEIKASGFDEKLVDYLNQGGFVYGGSAGSIIFGKDIMCAEYADENKIGLKDTAGLNLIKGFDLCCHYGTGDESKNIFERNAIEKYIEQGNDIIALPEHCALFVEGNAISFMGSGAAIFKGRLYRDD